MIGPAADAEEAAEDPGEGADRRQLPDLVVRGRGAGGHLRDTRAVPPRPRERGRRLGGARWRRCAREPDARRDPHRRRRHPGADRRAGRGSGGAGGARASAGGAERALRAWSAASPAGRRRRRGGWSASTASPTPATTASSCCCRDEEPRGPTPRWPGARREAAEFLAGLDGDRADGGRACGGRTRDRSRPCTGAAPPTRRQRESRAHEIAIEAGKAGLEPRWGRKVLELRPVGGGGKDGAVAALLAGEGLDRATYAGDDRTDLDAFRRLRELRRKGS